MRTITIAITISKLTYVNGDVLPIIQKMDRLIANARTPVNDTSP